MDLGRAPVRARVSTKVTARVTARVTANIRLYAYIIGRARCLSSLLGLGLGIMLVVAVAAMVGQGNDLCTSIYAFCMASVAGSRIGGSVFV